MKIRSALYELQEDVHRTATEKGWHDQSRSLGEEIALMHSELSEALEEVRNEKPVMYFRDACKAEHHIGGPYGTGYDHEGNILKTEGVAAEFADVIIRILDCAEERDIPVIEALLHKVEFNKTRSYRHGNKTL